MKDGGVTEQGGQILSVRLVQHSQLFGWLIWLLRDLGFMTRTNVSGTILEERSTCLY